MRLLTDVPPLAVPPIPPSDGLWDVRDMARFLKKSAAAVFKCVERRQLPFLKLGQAVRFDPVAVRAWLARHAVPPDGPRHGR